MQWTIERILAEISHLDVQMASYVERCAMQPGAPSRKMGAIVDWIKATAQMQCVLMKDVAEQFPQIYDEIVQEMAHGDIRYGIPGPHFKRQTKPSNN